MGWMYIHKEPGKSIFDTFKEEFPGHENEHHKVRLIDCACPNPREAYLAFEDIDKKTGKREVFAVVCLLDHQPRDYLNFGYKDMDETMGPLPTRCPERILKLLTPTDNETALKWRERCRENIERQKKWRRVKVGDVLEFERPIRFTNGDEMLRLRVADKRRRCFHDPKDTIGRIQYKLDRRVLLDTPFEVVETNAAA